MRFLRLRDELTPALPSLPDSAAEYLEQSFSRQPQSGEPYRIPGCYNLLKVHKPVLGDRLINGNHCAATQPGSTLLAKLTDPVVRQTPTYVQDSVSCLRLLREFTVMQSDLVITYDVEKLYPSTDHDLCKLNFAAALRKAMFKYLRFALPMLAIVLSENFCIFDDVIRRQIRGFATGASCASQVCHLHLEELLAPVFETVAALIRFHKRYIDDGFVIFRGSRALAEELFRQINNLHPSLTVTFDISDYEAIFLDLRFWKGPGWSHTGFLDCEVYQKPVSKFLYLPFRSETPRATLRGMIIGELIRFITHCSDYMAFLRIAKLFWFRLRARGYPHRFLNKAFALAPKYTDRDTLLELKPEIEEDRLHALVLTYSYSLARLHLVEIIHRHKELLPQHLRASKFILAWRSSRSVGRSLIPFTFSSHELSAPPATLSQRLLTPCGVSDGSPT